MKTSKKEKRVTKRATLYEAFEGGRMLTLAQIADFIYGKSDFATQAKAYGMVGAVRTEAEKNGILIHCVLVDGRAVYKFLNDASEVRTRIKPTKSRIEGGITKMKLLKEILTSTYKSRDGETQIAEIVKQLAIKI